MESVLKSVLTLSTVYYWLPKTHGNHQAFRNQLDWITGPGFVASQLLDHDFVNENSFFLLLITLKSVVVRELKAVWVLTGPCCHRSESASAGQRRHSGGSGRAGPAAGGAAELSAAEVCDQSERINNLLVI